MDANPIIMNKKAFFSICAILMLAYSSAFGQVEQPTKPFELINLERHQFKFDLLSPGLSYELGLFKNQSVSTSLGLGLATYQEGYAYGLAMNNRYRYYHNFNRRIDKGKNVSGNSGNYIAAAQAIFFSQLRLGNNIKGPS